MPAPDGGEVVAGDGGEAGGADTDGGTDSGGATVTGGSDAGLGDDRRIDTLVEVDEGGDERFHERGREGRILATVAVFAELWTRGVGSARCFERGKLAEARVVVEI
ncbi:hypothetical protein ABT126_35575 [Streptomyces sp. NPDC002012]|uniref:hypothetical protein n=1 Tax=unclassified Streptomyces TaxID=2593676 RepID=UPI0033203E8C